MDTNHGVKIDKIRVEQNVTKMAHIPKHWTFSEEEKKTDSVDGLARKGEDALEWMTIDSIRMDTAQWGNKMTLHL